MKIISLIIPIYNGEEYIESLVRLLGEITYKHFEILFIDNNSTDNSIETLKFHLNGSHLDFQILNETKQGAGYARNLGINSARGEYIAFLDCDDKIDPKKYEYDMSIFEKYDVDFVFCRTTRYYEDGRIVKHPIDGFTEGINEAPSLGLIWLKHYFSIQGTGAIIIKREVVKKLGGFPSIKTGEDAFLFIRTGLLYKGYFYNKELFFYNRHNKSTVATFNKEKNGVLRSYFNIRKNLFNDSIILNNSECKKIVENQLQIDILKFNKLGYKIKDIMKDEQLKELKLNPIIFNPLSLLINKIVFKNYYNPFFRLWSPKK